jgi:hypothetical protein
MERTPDDSERSRTRRLLQAPAVVRAFVKAGRGARRPLLELEEVRSLSQGAAAGFPLLLRKKAPRHSTRLKETGAPSRRLPRPLLPFAGASGPWRLGRPKTPRTAIR